MDSRSLIRGLRIAVIVIVSFCQRGCAPHTPPSYGFASSKPRPLLPLSAAVRGVLAFWQFWHRGYALHAPPRPLQLRSTAVGTFGRFRLLIQGIRSPHRPRLAYPRCPADLQASRGGGRSHD